MTRLTLIRGGKHPQGPSPVVPLEALRHPCAGTRSELPRLRHPEPEEEKRA
ncbi:MAG TPA: hypothetical protein VE990_14095 [Acidimicrobiales bacterium]|nr:hypothetical protein [Acidimicrobiales bacterium]